MNKPSIESIETRDSDSAIDELLFNSMCTETSEMDEALQQERCPDGSWGEEEIIQRGQSRFKRPTTLGVNRNISINNNLQSKRWLATLNNYDTTEYNYIIDNTKFFEYIIIGKEIG